MDIYRNVNMERIEYLPNELIDIIKEYIPIQVLVWTNKTNYLKYHSHTRKYLSKHLYFENLIRDTIRRDNDFVFQQLLKENFLKWLKMKKYILNI